MFALFSLSSPAAAYAPATPTNTNVWTPRDLQDTRRWASWQPESVVNAALQQQHNIRTNWEYRQFLQSQGAAIMHLDQTETYTALGTPASFVPPEGLSRGAPNPPPYTFVPGIQPTHIQHSDLKQAYLARQQQQQQLVARKINMEPN